MSAARSSRYLFQQWSISSELHRFVQAERPPKTVQKLELLPVPARASCAALAAASTSIRKQASELANRWTNISSDRPTL